MVSSTATSTLLRGFAKSYFDKALLTANKNQAILRHGLSKNVKNCSVRFGLFNPDFFLEISSLHHLSTGHVSSPASVQFLRYASYKNLLKGANLTDRVLTKTGISQPKYNIFQTTCADVYRTLASTISIVNESNQKTSIEQSLW